MRALAPESRIPNPESRIPNPESRIPNPESRIHFKLLLGLCVKLIFSFFKSFFLQNMLQGARCLGATFSRAFLLLLLLSRSVFCYAAENSDNLNRRDWALPVVEMSFCDGYTFGAGSYNTIYLRINCRATEDEKRITRLAAARWNQLTKRPLFYVPGDAYCHYNNSTLDEQSTITFLSHPAHNQRELGWAGYAEQHYVGWDKSNTRVRTTENWVFRQYENSWNTIEPKVEPTWMVGTDIFIASDFKNMLEYEKIALVMHEMGHGLGLRHQTASGNIMSYNEWAAIKDALRPLISWAMYIGDFDVLNFDTFTEKDLHAEIRDDAKFGQFAANLIQPQAQDKTALQCLYDFHRWGANLPYPKP